MKKRGIAIGLCICITAGMMAGCGKKAPGISDDALRRAQEEARAEVRRHLEDGSPGGQEKDGNGSGRREKDENGSGKETEDAGKSEKRSELARAAAEEALSRKEETRRRENESAYDKRIEDESHFGERRSDGTFQVDCLFFELPEGWEKDEYWSDSYDIVFAPGGDVDMALDCLIVSRVTEAFGMVDMFLENMDEMVEMLEEEISEEEEEYYVTIDDIGMTFLGHTLEMRAFVRDEEEAGTVVLYFAEDDENLYTLYAYTLLDEGEEISAEAGLSVQMEEALRMFFDTGRVENRKL